MQQDDLQTVKKNVRDLTIFLTLAPSETVISIDEFVPDEIDAETDKYEC